MQKSEVETKTVIVCCIMTVCVVFALFYYPNNTRATDIVVNDTQVRLIYRHKTITLDYKAIDKATIACADKTGRCGVVIYKGNKKYRTTYLTTTNNAKKLRDDINRRIK